ncbi:hypothetical protein PbB2_00804 [Candidatus Phycosocius bacilliformis]|uniref:Uncharacterized protein n=1 Tax=Candidatus Phycosocius bacilliformis TaxID=1445552 RepID=A0A2P2E7X3_9PROT|nr:hypothetical protein [Candidatus Phycosocius bacilliformis]GBF57144.1 hypothetical protein PbB2_00804 [Candidatus Phycosocius bacilliformis]
MNRPLDYRYAIRALAAIAVLIFVNACRGDVERPNIAAKETEQDWLNSNFGNPDSPKVFNQPETIMLSKDNGPNVFFIRDFRLQSQPALFNSGLWIRRKVPRTSSSIVPIENLHDLDFSAYGQEIGKNSCGQRLFKVVDHDRFGREISTLAMPPKGDTSLWVFVIPDPHTLIGCFSTDPTFGCSVYSEFDYVWANLVVPKINVCSWPAIRGQIQNAIDAGMVPASVRNSK